MTLITNLNYTTLLKQSTDTTVARGGGGAPDGNVYFDKVNNRIHLLGVDEVPTVDFGGGPVPNPLTNADGITMRAIYNFENQERRVDESLRQFKRGTLGSYRFAGAFNFVNGVKLDADDRNKVRGSGFIEYADVGNGSTVIDRVYHGARSLVAIQPSTTVRYALVTAEDEATLQAAAWSPFVRTGDVDEVVQVFGSTANGDAGAGDFDYRTRRLIIRVRSWQYNPGETTSVLSGISELGGFSAGYGVGETANPANTYALADVFGGAQVAPWTGMSLEKLAIPQTETGFNEADGNFTWVLHNTLGGTAAECAAYLDALSLQAGDIDSGAGTYVGLNGRVWYDRNAAGRIVTRSIGGEGLFIEGLSVAEKQNVVNTDDAGAAKTYPFFPEVRITVGSAAVSDTNAWYHVYYVDGAGSADFDTATAVTVLDSSGAAVKGNVSTDAVAGVVSFAFAYDTATEAGLSAGVDKDMVVLVEGDGGVAQAITFFTVTRTTTIPVTCEPDIDTNA